MGAGTCILVVDDHEMMLWGLRLALVRQHWVGRCLPARSLDEALDHVRRFQPHVAVVDLDLGGVAGEAVVRALRQERPTLRALFYSGARQMSQRTAHELGAYGFVSKTATAQDLVLAVQTVADGRRLRDRSTARPLPDVEVSRREAEVLHYLAEGQTNRAIADALCISPNTVKEHVSSILRKLEATNRTHAVQIARRRGMTG